MATEFDQCDDGLIELVSDYCRRLDLADHPLRVTTSRATYRDWIGRSVPSAYGGAYCFHGRTGQHLVLINLDRIDRQQTLAVEIVVAEELIHMRDRLDGDTRRHAHHGHDRIARRVAALTGASYEDIRSALKPVTRRPVKYRYRCPGCGLTVGRRRRGVWSCARCSPTFDRRFLMQIDDGSGIPEGSS